jgi:hypothetical protein
VWLKIGLEYEYLDDIENNIFSLPISNHDAIRHKKISKEIIFKFLKNFLNNYNIWNFKKSIT